MCRSCSPEEMLSLTLPVCCVFLFKRHRQFEMVIPTEDSVITEMTSTLRDWGTLWKQLYVVGGSPRPGDGFQRRLSKGSLGWHRAPAVSPPGVGGQGGEDIFLGSREAKSRWQTPRAPCWVSAKEAQVSWGVKRTCWEGSKIQCYFT